MKHVEKSKLQYLPCEKLRKCNIFYKVVHRYTTKNSSIPVVICRLRKSFQTEVSLEVLSNSVSIQTSKTLSERKVIETRDNKLISCHFIVAVGQKNY